MDRLRRGGANDHFGDGSGTLSGPLLGVGTIKYFENIFSSYNYQLLVDNFSVIMPEGMAQVIASVVSLFVGDGWHLTLGVLFMLVVIFLPGGIMEGIERLRRRFWGGIAASR